MISIIYSEGGMPISDFLLDTFVNQLKDGETYRISSMIAIIRLQNAVLKNEIPKNDIEFFHEGVTGDALEGTLFQIQHDIRGEFSDYPKGFMDKFSELLMERL
jgi:hypothetical protein